MIADRAKLQILELTILNSSLEVVSLSDIGDYARLVELYSQYIIDIDYVFRSDGENGNLFLQAKIHVNKVSQPLPGYSISAEAVAVISKDSIENIELNNNTETGDFYFGSINILINFLRGYISTLTAHAPFSRYTLPSIDLGTLVRKKREQREASSKEKS